MRYKSIAVLFLFFMSGSVLFTSCEAAPVCSFSYSVKGCSIYLTPLLSDVAYYQWSIAPSDGTTILGCTGWIPNATKFTQMFSMDHEGEYRVMLQARSTTGATSEYSSLIHVIGSAQSTVNTIQVQPTLVNETFADRFNSWFSSFPLLAQLVFIIIVVFLGAVSFDAVFHVSRGWKKKIMYKTEARRR